VHGDGLQILNHGDDVPLTSTYQGSEGERDHEGARGGRQLPPRSGSRGVARGRGADGITSATVRERRRLGLQAPPASQIRMGSSDLGAMAARWWRGVQGGAVVGARQWRRGGGG
jgi:hypothetical protein